MPHLGCRENHSPPLYLQRKFLLFSDRSVKVSKTNKSFQKLLNCIPPCTLYSPVLCFILL